MGESITGEMNGRGEGPNPANGSKTKRYLFTPLLIFGDHGFVATKESSLNEQVYIWALQNTVLKTSRMLEGTWRHQSSKDIASKWKEADGCLEGLPGCVYHFIECWIPFSHQ